MEYRSSEVKAGLFIFTSFIALAVMIFMLGNLKDYFKPKRQLRIVFNFTGGLEIGAPVRYAGMAIGRVINVELSDQNDKTDDEHVIVVAAIDPPSNIKKNSVAMIKTSWLMGGLYIDLRPGTSNAEPLAANELLKGQDSFELTKIGDVISEFVIHIERFTDIAETLAIDSKATLTALQGSLANIDQVIIENRQNLHANLKNMTKISGEMAALVDKKDGEIQKTLTHVSSLAQRTDHLLSDNEGEIQKALTHISSLAQRTDALLSQKEQGVSDIIDHTQHATHEMDLMLTDNRQKITNMVRSLENGKISDKIDSVAGNVEQALKQTNGVLIENRRNLLELVKNLRETSESLKEFSDDIKRNPWKLIRKTDEPPEQTKSNPAGNQDLLRMKRLSKVSSK